MMMMYTMRFCNPSRLLVCVCVCVCSFVSVFVIVFVNMCWDLISGKRLEIEARFQWTTNRNGIWQIE